MKRYILLTIFLFFQLNRSLYAQQEHFESSYLLNGVYPNDEDAFWFPNDTEVQGVTNDNQNWFITTTGHRDINGTDYWGKLWRIPLSKPLGDNSNSNPNVESIEMFDIPELNFPSNPYWHWGDPDHYKFNGTDYILAPIYPINGTGIIACFRANNLDFISFASIALKPGWCAVDNDGFLYSSVNHASAIKKYEINWEQLISGDNTQVLNEVDEYNINFLSSSYDDLRHMQGGEFSQSGELLFIASGSAGCHGSGPNDGDPDPSDGIHVIRTSDWNEVQFSQKSGDGYFVYNFENDCEGFLGSESPEGLTIWDLDGQNSSNIEGQLHVLTFHWNLGIIGGSNNHKISMHHFQNELLVDKDFQNSSLRGTRNAPFNSFNQAFFTYPVWSGAKIILKSGIYNDTGTYNQRVLIKSEGGAAIIGQQ